MSVGPGKGLCMRAEDKYTALFIIKRVRTRYIEQPGCSLEGEYPLDKKCSALVALHTAATPIIYI